MKRKNNNPMVTVWNMPAGTFTEIPRAELAPGMIQATIQGRSGTVWVEATSIPLKETEYKHPPFTGEMREAIQAIQESFPGVYERSFEFWEDGFRKDAHPEGEIGIWIAIAGTYLKFSDGQTLKKRKEVFRLLTVCSNSSRDAVFEVFRCELLSSGESKAIVSDYYGHFKKE